MIKSTDALVSYYVAISNADLEKISTCFDLPSKLISLYGVVDMLTKKDIINTYNNLIRTWNNQGISNRIGFDINKFEVKHIQNNIDLVKTIIKVMGASEDLIEYVDDRPGHDLRYAIDNAKIRSDLNFYPEHTLEEGLKKTIAWYNYDRI